MRFEWTNIFADIDPRLQRLMQRRRRGISTPPTASTEVGEVAAIALVNDLEAWLSMSEVRVGAELGSTTDGNIIVTARVPVSRLQCVRTSPCVVSLQASQNLQLATDDLTHASSLKSGNPPTRLAPQPPSLPGNGENLNLTPQPPSLPGNGGNLNLTPQPPSLPGNGENLKPLSLQERGLERGFYPMKR